MYSTTMPSATSLLPPHQTAIVAKGAGELDIQHNALLPTLTPETAIVRVAAVAINPVDAKMLDYSPVPGAIHGYEFAGTVVALGPNTPGHIQVGDRVAGFVHGMNKTHPDIGAFAEYVAAPAGLLLRIPPTMRFEDAASIGLGLYTAGLGLYQELGLPFPNQTPALRQLHLTMKRLLFWWPAAALPPAREPFSCSKIKCQRLTIQVLSTPK